MHLDKKSKIIMSIERASHDLRKGFPVVIDGLLALSPETASPDMVAKTCEIEGEPLNLVITANRLRFLLGKASDGAAFSAEITKADIGNIAGFCGIETVAENITIPDFYETNKLEAGSLQLARIAELMPSLLVKKLASSVDSSDFLSVSVADLAKYNELVSYDLIEACRTDIALKHAMDSQIIAYRPNIGGKEHYAIIIGKLPDVPLVRVHSSCYTGDLLDSLACDCRDQLHLAIDKISAAGGGIILYMLQEGRGIGLINKLRAYSLKGQGLDTVDANEALGFDDDERLFAPAAQILQKMGIAEIRLLTNNPKKAAGLSACGIKVKESVPHIIEHNEHNEAYLKTKSERLGHKGL